MRLWVIVAKESFLLPTVVRNPSAATVTKSASRIVICHVFFYRWSERVMNEFFEQGEREKEMGLPVSAFLNRRG
jgi:hypothetical protein